MTALPAPPDEQVRALAVTILKRSEFAFWHDTPWLISFLAWLSGLWETDPVLYWAMLVGLVAVALLLLAHVTWAVRRALAVAPPARPPRPDGAAPPFLDEAERAHRARGGVRPPRARRHALPGREAPRAVAHHLRHRSLGLPCRLRPAHRARIPGRAHARAAREAGPGRDRLVDRAGGALRGGRSRRRAARGAAGPGGRDGGGLPRPGRGRRLRAPRGRGPAPPRRGRVRRRRPARRVGPAPGD